MTAARFWRALGLALLLLAGRQYPLHAAEICEYLGEGNHDARIGVTTIAERRGGDETIRVLWRLSARALGIFRFEYWIEEISTWRGGRLLSVALNIRYVVNNRIKRQQWDVFARDGEGFAAWRVQAKRRDDLAAKHPGFAAHWDPAQFGRPWLGDYRDA